MRALAEAIRAAGNVFLTPVRLTEVPGAEAWRRALLVGSANPAAMARAGAALREVIPDVAVEAPGGANCPVCRMRPVRRRGYDVACLMLTGEGRRGEKLVGLLSGAGVVLAHGRGGEWYQLHLPPFRPASLRWWARAVLATMVCDACKKAGMLIAAVDALRGLVPKCAGIRDPGPPKGREVTFIVPSYNQRQLMDFCLPPLLAEAGDRHQVLVVDDAGTDGTADYVRKRYPRVAVLQLRQNRGFAGAVRAGIAASGTPLFALINTDVQVRP
ncbi:MAG: glycosyltransferase, partial [Armatimonadota bacterium]